MILFISLVYLISTFQQSLIYCQQSSAQVEKIEMNPVEPRPGESVKIRCYLKNVDPTKKIKPDILWSFQGINIIAFFDFIKKPKGYFFFFINLRT